MKSVMLSIQPKWCELIANGRKTIEVRKTRPSCNLPFKCYIYETKHGGGSGKVIGEFVCDRFYLFGDMDSVGVGYWSNGHFRYVDTFETTGFSLSKSQLSRRDLMLYRKGQNIYGWHISNLKIYGKPKELSDFIRSAVLGCGNQGDCDECKFYVMGDECGIFENYCVADFDTEENEILKRPPQSWCYVEVINIIKGEKEE